jgi:hypothetical protein
MCKSYRSVYYLSGCILLLALQGCAGVFLATKPIKEAAKTQYESVLTYGKSWETAKRTINNAHASQDEFARQVCYEIFLMYADKEGPLPPQVSEEFKKAAPEEKHQVLFERDYMPRVKMYIQLDKLVSSDPHLIEERYLPLDFTKIALGEAAIAGPTEADRYNWTINALKVIEGAIMNNRHLPADQVRFYARVAHFMHLPTSAFIAYANGLDRYYEARDQMDELDRQNRAQIDYRMANVTRIIKAQNKYAENDLEAVDWEKYLTSIGESAKKIQDGRGK